MTRDNFNRLIRVERISEDGVSYLRAKCPFCDYEEEVVVRYSDFHAAEIVLFSRLTLHAQDVHKTPIASEEEKDD